MKAFAILVVDDDSDFLMGIIRNLKKRFTDIEILGSSSGEEALEIVVRKDVGIILSDFRMSGLSGQELLASVLLENKHICFIMITGFGTVENAVDALKMGAWDFLTKPVERDVLYHTVERAIQHSLLARENQQLQAVIKTLCPDEGFCFVSGAMRELQEKIAAIAVTDYSVLITGESGSGKEYIARMLHEFSPRSDQSCHALNCPAIPESLLESELFGHVKGAFTGADRRREGFFLSADKGTLILDEIGDISPVIQAKLLKFLQDKEVKPVGSSVSRKVNVRIIALTNQNLEQKIKEGSFREDLYYRLNVLSVVVPPLRERKEDIPGLVREFMVKTCLEMGVEPMMVEPAVLAHLAIQPWRGNVRELLNFVRRLVVFSNGHSIDLGLVNMVEGNTSAPGGTAPHILYKDAKKEVLDHFSRDYLRQLLDRTGGNISKVSRMSGLERASIQKIIKRLNIDVGQYRA